jgi:hypothetical protein
MVTANPGTLRSSLRPALQSALLAFLLSRLIVWVAILVPPMLLPAAFEGVPSDRVVMRASSEAITTHVDALVRTNDAGWYHGVATGGYEQRPFDASAQANWAFFPLHPTLWAGAIAVFGDSLWAALLLPNVMLFLALVVLHQLARASGRDQATAARAVFVAALLPSSYFLSLPWTESLFLLTSTACALFALRRQWLWMALAGIAASATRFPGVLLLPAIAAQLLVLRERSWRAWLAACCMPLGAVCFALYLWSITGNALAFADIQSAWGRHFELPIRAIGIVLLKPDEIAIDWNLRLLNLAMLGTALLALRHLIYRRDVLFAAFLALCVLAPLMTGTLTSMSRYVTALFPLALALADWTNGATRERAWFTLSAATLALMALAFSLGLTFAAA